MWGPRCPHGAARRSRLGTGRRTAGHRRRARVRRQWLRGPVPRRHTVLIRAQLRPTAYLRKSLQIDTTGAVALCEGTARRQSQLIRSFSKGFHDFRKALRNFRKAFWDFQETILDLPSTRELVCERRDSNPDLVKDRHLNPVDWQ